MDRQDIRNVKSKKRRVLRFVIGIPKRLLWNRVTKWILRKILFLPLKVLQLLGKEIDAITSFLT